MCLGALLVTVALQATIRFLSQRQPTPREQFFTAFHAVPAGSLGRCDATMLAPMLSRILPAPGATAATPHLVIDIGANVGDTTDDLVHFFTSAGCLSYHAAFPETTGKSTFAPCDVRAARVLSYEPMPANYNALLARGAHAHWLADVWSAFPIAVTSPSRVPASGMIDFFSSGAVGDQQGALSSGAAYTVHKIAVNATTLDAHLAALGLQQTPILLLKVDTEGFDADVFLGATAILARQQVRIITFEYNTKWGESPGSSLSATVKALGAAAYDCFFITPDNLVPLTGVWWHDSYEIWQWSNVVCFRRCDQVIQRRVLAFFNKLPVDAAAIVGCAPPATCTECAV